MNAVSSAFERRLAGQLLSDLIAGATEATDSQMAGVSTTTRSSRPRDRCWSRVLERRGLRAGRTIDPSRGRDVSCVITPNVPSWHRRSAIESRLQERPTSVHTPCRWSSLRMHWHSRPTRTSCFGPPRHVIAQPISVTALASRAREFVSPRSRLRDRARHSLPAATHQPGSTASRAGRPRPPRRVARP